MRSQEHRPWLRLGVPMLWLAALLAIRAWYIEPASWAAFCTASAEAPACLPRTALLAMQEQGVWGVAALVCGVAAFLGWPLALASVLLGLAGVENYDASFGMLGLALGVWAWISPVAR